MSDPEIIITEMGGACPFQAEGTIGGWPFYFRSRGEHWSLDVAEPGFEPVGESVWEWRQRYSDEPFAAGYLEEEEARGFILEAARRFMAWRAEHPEVDGGGRRTAQVLREELRRTYERLGEECRARFAVERKVVRLSHALGLNAGEHVIATLQVENGVED